MSTWWITDWKIILMWCNSKWPPKMGFHLQLHRQKTWCKSQLNHLPAWPHWTKILTSLRVRLLICKIEHVLASLTHWLWKLLGKRCEGFIWTKKYCIDTRDSLLQLQTLLDYSPFAEVWLCVYMDESCMGVNTRWSSISMITLFCHSSFNRVSTLKGLLVCSGFLGDFPTKHHSRNTIMNYDRLRVKATWTVQYKMQFYIYYFILECKMLLTACLVVF